MARLRPVRLPAYRPPARGQLNEFPGILLAIGSPQTKGGRRAPVPRVSPALPRRGSGLLLVQHFVDEAEVLGLLGGEVAVALRLALDLLGVAAGVPGQDAVDGVLHAQQLLHGDVDVGGLAADLAPGL